MEKYRLRLHSSDFKIVEDECICKFQMRTQLTYKRYYHVN